MLFTRLFLAGILATAFVTAQAQEMRFAPSNPPGMKPLTNHDSRAYQSAAHFKRGANIGNYLEIPAGEDWGVRIGTSDFDHIKAEGFDHVRLPVAWQEYTGPGPEFKISSRFFARVDFVVTNCLARGLAVMVNDHHFDAFTSDPAGQMDKFVAIWRQVAEHYAQAPDMLIFELINEPRDATTTPVLNGIYPRVIAEIRKTNPSRAIVVSGSDWSNVGEIKNLVLPADDDNLIVTIHCYEPFHFTHQGAQWAGADVQITGIKFPGPPAFPLNISPVLNVSPGVRYWINKYNTEPLEKNPSSPYAFEDKMKYAHDWSEYYGRPIYVGEFGAYTKADDESRANFYGAFARACEQQHLGWALWDWNAGFHYWDPEKNAPAPGMREAIFGK